VELHLHSFLTSALEGSVYLHSPTALHPGKAPSVPIHYEDGWISDTFEKRKPLAPPGNQIQNKQSKMEDNESERTWKEKVVA
jgi:hypothetical protein